VENPAGVNTKLHSLSVLLSVLLSQSNETFFDLKSKAMQEKVYKKLLRKNEPFNSRNLGI
jgi:hypothetical protein